MRVTRSNLCCHILHIAAPYASEKVLLGLVGYSKETKQALLPCPSLGPTYQELMQEKGAHLQIPPSHYSSHTKFHAAHPPSGVVFCRDSTVERCKHAFHKFPPLRIGCLSPCNPLTLCQTLLNYIPLFLDQGFEQQN